MAIEVRIPTLGESLSEGVIARWLAADGAAVQKDDPLLELETDKASVEIAAEEAGILHVERPEGATVQVGEVVAHIESSPAAPAPAAAPAAKATAPALTPPSPAPAAAAVPTTDTSLSPAVRHLVAEHALDPQAIRGTGRGGRITKGDVLAHLEVARPERAAAEAPAAAAAPPAAAPQIPAVASPAGDERVPMTHLRQRIAERLLQAQRTAAILTTFNEVDMSAVMDLRGRHKTRFADTHGVPLGFMSFFARACVQAVHDLPVINARIDGTDIVYERHVHLGVAVASDRGLVVPIVHNAEGMSFADLEREIARLAALARDNKLAIADLSGGTFTISNGGVFGSLLSTPILNPPQSAILGMHKIEKRPVVVDDQIVVRPMMYLALSYDHRLIDGADAVTFLVRVKERLEDPTRLLFDI